MAMKTTNSRKKKLEAIQKKIATFIFTETYTDEGDAQDLLAQAVETITRAGNILVANDENAPKPSLDEQLNSEATMFVAWAKDADPKFEVRTDQIAALNAFYSIGLGKGKTYLINLMNKYEEQHG